MKKIVLTTTILLGLLSYSFAQNVNIPDASLKATLVNYNPKIDTDNDKEISVSEALAYTGSINLSSGFIKSLVGIEAFKNITQLTSSNNKLTTIDVSNNTALTLLNISNAGITSLDVSKNTALIDLECPFNQLSSLDISKNIVLTNLNCSQNQITTLSVTNNVDLINLNCSQNQLTSLEISQNTALNELNCSQNQISTLDFSKNINLEKLNCGINNLSELNVSKNVKLTTFTCNSLNINSLDISSNPLLTFLNCFNNKLTTIDLSKNTLLQDVNCSNNLITSLYFFNHANLKSLRADYNKLGSLYVSGAPVLKQLNAAQNTTLTTICYDKLQDTTTWFKNANTILSSTCGEIVTFDDINFKNELLPNTEINTNADFEIQVSEANAFEGAIYISDKNISSLQGIENFTKLTSLFCDNNAIKTLDVSKNTSLTNLNCSSNQLTSLDISKNVALTELNLSENQIATINVSNLNLLSILNCGYNKITSLDVSKNTALVNLFCGSNLLSNINISNNTLLTSLSVSGNQLSTIDLSKNLLLQEFDCFANKIDRLDVSKNKALVSLSAFNMPSLYLVCINPVHNTSFWTIDQTAKYSLLCNDEPKVTIVDANLRKALLENPTKIDTDNDTEISIKEAKAFTGKIEIQYKQITDLTGIEEFVNLTEIDASGNTLTNLSLTNNKALTTILCNSCKLTSINLSNNTQLGVLWIPNNQLKTIDVSKNTFLTYFGATNNQIKSIDVSTNVLLNDLNVEKNQLISIDVSKNIALNYLDCGYNALTRLDVTNNPNLITVYCSSNPDLKTICITNQVTDSWSKDDNAKYSNNCFPVAYFTDPNFKTALLNHIPKIDTDNDGEISFIEADNYSGQINVTKQSIENIVGIDAFKNITALDLSGNQLRKLDFSKNLELKVLKINDNPLLGIAQVSSMNPIQNSVTIDLSKNLKLEELNCSNNNLTDLDLSNQILLKKLDCSQNPLLKEIYIQLSIINQDFIKDETAEWKAPTVTSIDNIIVSEAINVVKAYNLQGKEVPLNTKGQLIILLYSNGTTQKVMQE